MELRDRRAAAARRSEVPPVQPVRRLVVCLASLVAVLLVAAPASAGCKKSLTLRETPGGDPQPAQLIECDESETPALLEPSAHLRLCDPKVLAETGVAFEDCARAVDAARAGFRKAKIRAALQKGEDDAAIALRYGAAEGELDALRVSVDFSGPIRGDAEASEEAAQ